MVTQNLHVVALPVVVDLVLWLGPRVSIGPLLQPLMDVLTSQPATDPQMTRQIEEAARLLGQFGEQFNLLAVMSGVPMFQIPSLLARRAPVDGSPLGISHVVSVSSVFSLIPWWGILALVGLLLGFLYLSEISRQVAESPGAHLGMAGEAGVEGRSNGRDSARAVVWKLARFFLFAFGFMAAGSIFLTVWILTVALSASLAQPLGILVWIGGVGLLSYTVLHLLFVIPGLFLGERRLLRAIGESILLTHTSLSSVVGFVLLTVVIYEGLGFAWSLPRGDSWIMFIGIVGNAFVATGLTEAAFVFYGDRATAGRSPMAPGG